MRTTFDLLRVAQKRKYKILIYLVRSGALQGFEKLVSDMGGNPYLLLKLVGLSESQLREPDSYLAYEKVAELLEVCALMCQAPTFGLQLSAFQNNLTLGDIGLIASQQARIGDAITHIIEHLRLHANGVNIHLDEREGKVTISITFEFDSPRGYGQISQLSVGLLANTIGYFMGSDICDIDCFLTDPVQIPAPGSAFYSSVKFGASFNGVQFSSFWLNMRTNRNEESIQAYFERQLEKMVFNYPHDLRHQVSQVIQALLPSGECCVNRVSKSLNIHPRVLQKRLKARNLKYSGILADVRKELALQAVMDPCVDVTELAFKLGFADVAVLSRSFRRWFGCSISQYRRENLV